MASYSRSEPRTFRRRLVEMLAYDTRWPRQAALYGGPSKLAADLGVTEAVFADAMALVRFGFGSKKSGPASSKLVHIHIYLPVEVEQLLLVRAGELDRDRDSLIRDLLHAAMQSNMEPHAQSRLGGRRKKVVLRGKLLSGEYRATNLRVSPGLQDAVRRRAVGYGVSPHIYVQSWVMDLVDGRLGELDIRHIQPSQMFDSAEAYVLPILAEPG